ncbi:MAG: hypothetical protein ACFFGZ_10300 [Candidatus Thorarchaeota archaeon]
MTPEIETELDILEKRVKTEELTVALYFYLVHIFEQFSDIILESIEEKIALFRDTHKIGYKKPDLLFFSPNKDYALIIEVVSSLSFKGMKSELEDLAKYRLSPGLTDPFPAFDLTFVCPSKDIPRLLEHLKELNSEERQFLEERLIILGWKRDEFNEVFRLDLVHNPTMVVNGGLISFLSTLQPIPLIDVDQFYLRLIVRRDAPIAFLLVLVHDLINVELPRGWPLAKDFDLDEIMYLFETRLKKDFPGRREPPLPKKQKVKIALDVLVHAKIIKKLDDEKYQVDYQKKLTIKGLRQETVRFLCSQYLKFRKMKKKKIREESKPSGDLMKFLEKEKPNTKNSQ